MQGKIIVHFSPQNYFILSLSFFHAILVRWWYTALIMKVDLYQVTWRKSKCYNSTILSPYMAIGSIEMTTRTPLKCYIIILQYTSVLPPLRSCINHPISRRKNHSLWFFFILEMLRIIGKLHFSLEKASKQKNYSFWPPSHVFFLIFSLHQTQKLMKI